MRLVNEPVTYYSRKETNYSDMGVDQGKGFLAPIVEYPSSQSLGAGLIKLTEAGNFEWQVLYDEVLFVVSGELVIVQDGTAQTGTAGDVFFLKEGAKITYSTPSETEFFYSIYPANWREIRGLK